MYLKYVLKFCRLNFEIVAITRPCIRFFLIQIAFQSTGGVELDFGGFVIRICLNIKSRWIKKIDVFSQGTDDSKYLRCETLCTGDYEYVNISSFAVSGIKLWLEEDGNLDRNDPLYS